MCAVSMVLDHYQDKWNDPLRHWVFNPSPFEVSREEFEALKKEVLEMKELLKRAKKYDADNNQPDCEIDEKVALVRKVAELVGVDLDDIITKA